MYAIIREAWVATETVLRALLGCDPFKETLVLSKPCSSP